MEVFIEGVTLSSILHQLSLAANDLEPLPDTIGLLFGKVTTKVRETSDSETPDKKHESLVEIQGFQFLDTPPVMKLQISQRELIDRIIQEINKQPVVGWFLFRSDTPLSPSAEELYLHDAIEDSLRKAHLSAPLLFGMFTTGSTKIKSTRSFDYNFVTVDEQSKSVSPHQISLQWKKDFFPLTTLPRELQRLTTSFIHRNDLLSFSCANQEFRRYLLDQKRLGLKTCNVAAGSTKEALKEITEAISKLSFNTMKAALLQFLIPGFEALDLESLRSLYSLLPQLLGLNFVMDTISEEAIDMCCDLIGPFDISLDKKTAVQNEFKTNGFLPTFIKADVELREILMTFFGLIHGWTSPEDCVNLLFDEMVMLGLTAFFKRIPLGSLKEHCKEWELEYHDQVSEDDMIDKLMCYIFNLEPLGQEVEAN
eukprot:TRINITY_DN8576_c0_g1_i1.p1 TRINITY_DN8576_c0_g1~~TRINITY_DN8576_c0_g1_i1.p1  ORF type:complete len:424 (+),score=64.95 TRINITY_DN8576_c0_g1_i1:145-1416(+)